MLKQTMIAVTSILLLGIHSVTFGQEEIYVDTERKTYVGVSVASLTLHDSANDWTNIVLLGRLGYALNEHVIGELRLGTSVTDDTSDFKDVTLLLLYGGYLKLGAPVDVAPSVEKVFPYLMLGYTKEEDKVENQASSTTRNFDSSGLSYGLGVDVDFSNKITINAEYTVYLNDADTENNLGGVSKTDLTGFSVGLSYRFS